MAQDTFTDIEGSILTIGGQRVILDHDLARLYGVSTKRLNEQVSSERLERARRAIRLPCFVIH